MYNIPELDYNSKNVFKGISLVIVWKKKQLR
jgi:hypothetical protein